MLLDFSQDLGFICFPINARLLLILPVEYEDGDCRLVCDERSEERVLEESHVRGAWLYPVSLARVLEYHWLTLRRRRGVKELLRDYVKALVVFGSTLCGL